MTQAVKNNKKNSSNNRTVENFFEENKDTVLEKSSKSVPQPIRRDKCVFGNMGMITMNKRDGGRSMLILFLVIPI